MKRKHKITMLTCLALGLASTTMNAQIEFISEVRSQNNLLLIGDSNNDRGGGTDGGTIFIRVGNQTLQSITRDKTTFNKRADFRNDAFFFGTVNMDRDIIFRDDNAKISSKTSYFINNHKIGIGTRIPEESVHVKGGNVRVDNGQYQSFGEIVLHPDVDDTGDDAIEFRNSSNEEMAKVQDGDLFLRRIGNSGGTISSNTALTFQPDNDNTGDDRIVFLNQRGNEMTRIQDGVITTDQVRLNVTTFPDYVFAKDYQLMPLKEVAQYIKANKHLPNMPTEAEVVAEGMNVGQINTILVEKVEELTLHTINQEEKIEQLMKKIEALEAAMNK